MTRVAAIAAALIVSVAAAGCGDSAKEATMTSPSKPSASRAPPPRVAPVLLGGIRYAQIAGDPKTDGQAGGFLAAYDSSNRELWRLKVYDNPRRPELEGDVQDVWFRSLRVESSKLLIENERGERFEIDPATRRVLTRPAPTVPPRDIDPVSGQPFLPLPK